MRWRNVGALRLRSEEVASVHAEIVELALGEKPFLLTVWRVIEGISHSGSDRHATLDDAKAAALPLMRAAVIAARDEAHNAVLDASRWLRANGGEP